MSRLRQYRVLWRGLQVFFAGTAIFFLVRTMAAHWSQIIVFPWQFRIAPMVGSMILQLAALLLWATIWRHMAVRSGCPVRWADGVRLYAVSNLARYIPGSIWGYVSRAYLGRDTGLNGVGVGISALWEVGITVVASLLLTAVTVPIYPWEIPRVLLWLVLAIALFCFVGLLPPVFNRWVRFLERWQPAHHSSFRWRDFCLYLVSAFGTHVLVGTAFFLFSCSFADVDVRFWWSFVGLWSFAATAGLVMVLVPHGLGVKEGLLILFLRPFVSVESAILISVTSRLWLVAGELFAALLAILLLRKAVNNP